jgi:hypothetical protein
MRDHRGYTIVRIGPVEEKKLQAAIRKGKITWKADELKGNKPLLLHPIAAAMIEKAQKKGKGVTGMMLSGDDILEDLKFHGDKSIWGWLDGYKKRKQYSWVYGESEE